MKTSNFTRRQFCRTLFAASLAPALAPTLAAADGPFTGRIYKAVKVTMIRGNQPLLEKFEIAKAAGFDGISLFAPGKFDLDEARRARDATGLHIHNINNTVNWTVRLSDPDPAVRAQSLAAMKAALQFAHDAGGDSILQVIGKVTDEQNENHEQVRQRSQELIRQALPLAARLGVRILCENVGNGFCPDAQQWADYLDELDSPWVGAFFDIGNHHRFGGADHWIRTLGQRIVKIDVKDHNVEKERNCDLFQGHVDWSAVRRELGKLRFTGWATAEVSGGDLAHLRQVAQDMDKALGI
jgi:L-ribulose-5-phosphate 3-epimerase